MQVLFILGGLVFMALGLLSSVLTGSPKTKADWTCTTPTQNRDQQCFGSVESGPANVPTLLVVSGLGLEIAAAAIAFGGRKAPAPASTLPAQGPTPGFQQRPAGPTQVPQGGGWQA